MSGDENMREYRGRDNLKVGEDVFVCCEKHSYYGRFGNITQVRDIDGQVRYSVISEGDFFPAWPHQLAL